MPGYRDYNLKDDEFDKYELDYFDKQDDKEKDHVALFLASFLVILVVGILLALIFKIYG